MKNKEVIFDAKTGKEKIIEKELTEKEIAELKTNQDNFEKQNRIAELITNLNETDYKAIKFAEGLISAEDYEPTKLQRQKWRDEINELESGGNE